MGQELLHIENLQAWYGESHVLHGVNLTVNEGEVVSLQALDQAAALMSEGPRRAPSGY